MTESRMISASTELVIGGNKLSLKLLVPMDEVPPETLLPTLHGLSNQITAGLEKKVDKTPGVKISCKKGCGACCRQHVPISPVEARFLAAMIAAMPEDDRKAMKRRFKQAALRLQDSGLLGKALYYNRMSHADTTQMVKDYFKLGIACPFLEDESCSIHPDRPLICREYLVISSPEHCASLDQDQIQRLNLPVSISETFSAMDGVKRKDGNQYLPLIMALEWVERYPDETEFRPGTAWVQDFFEALSGSDLPDPEASQEANA